MHKKLTIFFLVVLSINFISAINVGVDGNIGIDLITKISTGGGTTTNNYYSYNASGNTTQMDVVDGNITIKESWLTTFFNSLTSTIYNLFSQNDTTLDNRITIINSTIQSSNASWLSTFNQTYQDYSYNVSLNHTKLVFDAFNSTWDNSWVNAFSNLWYNHTSATIGVLGSNFTQLLTINSTLNMQVLYNSTSLLFAQMNNNSATLQQLLNSSYVFQGSSNQTKVSCSNITGGTDTDFCTDATGTGGGSSPIWINDSTQIYNNLSYPSYLNLSGVLYVNGTSGNVGIGTTSPSSLLEIRKSSSGLNELNVSGVLYVNGTSLITRLGTAGATTYGLSVNGDISLRHTLSIPDSTDVNSGNGISLTTESNKFGTNTQLLSFDVGDSTKASAITFKRTDNFGFGGAFNWTIGMSNKLGTAVSPDFEFYTYSIPALTIKNGTGNVGIGTTSPGTRLEIAAPTSGETFKVTGKANEWASRTVGSSTSGQSYGAAILAGTTSADTAFGVYSQNGATNYFHVIGNGNVGIGTIPTDNLHIQGTPATNETLIRLSDSTANCTINPEPTLIRTVCASDLSLKKNIENISTLLALNKILSYPVVNYELKNSGQKYIGVVAQDIQKIDASMIEDMGDGILGVSEPNAWETIAGIQELNKRVVSLETQNLDLKKCIKEAVDFKEVQEKCLI